MFRLHLHAVRSRNHLLLSKTFQNNNNGVLASGALCHMPRFFSHNNNNNHNLFLRRSAIQQTSFVNFFRTNHHNFIHMTLWNPSRFMSVRGKENNKNENENKTENNKDENNKNEEEEKKEEDETKQKTEGEEDENAQSGKKNKKKKTPKPRASFMDNLRQLKADFYKYPEIYNSVTFINFVLFTIFCLSSTGTKSESVWWEEEWGLSYDTTVQKYHNYIMDTLKPWTWLCHSFMMNNFLSMSYAMILVHCLGHPIAATIGSKNLWQYVLLTSVFSGILMQAGQFGYYSLYHHNKISPTEKQFGPWDVCTALFLMNYYLYHVNPISFLLSFNGWLKYACLVGQLCICYFDWQPTVAGLGVGYLLCQFHPALRVKNFIK